MRWLIIKNHAHQRSLKQNHGAAMGSYGCQYWRRGFDLAVGGFEGMVQ